MSNAVDFYVERSGKAFESGNVDQAIAEMNQAIRLYEQQPPGPERDQQLGLAYGARAEARQKKGDFAEAIADYNRALALLPTTPETTDAVATCYMERGACHFMKGRAENNPRLLETAETDLNYAVNLYERRGTDAPGGIYAKRGIFYALTGRQAEAKHDLERAQRAGVPVPGDVWAEVNADEYETLAVQVDKSYRGGTLLMVGLVCLGALWSWWLMSQTTSSDAEFFPVILGVGLSLFLFQRNSAKKKELAASMDTQHPGFREFYANRQQRRSAKIAKGALLAGAIGAATVRPLAKQSYDEIFGRK